MVSTFDIREHIGVIKTYGSGWTKELNVVSWDGKEPKYDLRDWDPGHDRMSKGVEFTENALKKLVNAYKDYRSSKQLLDAKSNGILKQAGGSGIADVSCETYEHIAQLCKDNRGFVWEANIASWNKGDPKLDIRGWRKDTQGWRGYFVTRGVTLTEDEADTLAWIVLNLKK